MIDSIIQNDAEFVMLNVGLEQEEEKSLWPLLAHEEITTKTPQRKHRRRPDLQNETGPSTSRQLVLE